MNVVEGPSSVIRPRSKLPSWMFTSGVSLTIRLDPRVAAMLMSRCTRPSARPWRRKGARKATDSCPLAGERKAPLAAPTGELSASVTKWRPSADGKTTGRAVGAHTI